MYRFILTVRNPLDHSLEMALRSTPREALAVPPDMVLVMQQSVDSQISAHGTTNIRLSEVGSYRGYRTAIRCAFGEEPEEKDALREAFVFNSFADALTLASDILDEAEREHAALLGVSQPLEWGPHRVTLLGELQRAFASERACYLDDQHAREKRLKAPE